MRTGRLLPHLFTLTSLERGGYFLLRYSTLADRFPLGNMVLCVARTFLLPMRASGRPSCYPAAKIRKTIYITR